MRGSAALARAEGADPLALRSVEIIRAGQGDSGAYVASPTFDIYRYAWLRDGAFCARAMDVAGERASAAAFHRWAARAIAAQRGRADAVLATLADGGTPPHDAMLPTRYTLDGSVEAPGEEPWPNFQLDGYGTWLWALARHLGGGRPDGELAEGVAVAARYLAATWRLPCFGCWEEPDDGEHAFTIAAAAAGLAAAARMLRSEALVVEAERARRWLLRRFVVGDRFGRCASDPRPDGSLLWLAVPLGVLDPGEPLVAATVEAVRRDLVGPGGGVRRYAGDSYYGGGQWILLTCSLGWHDAVTGARAAYERSRAWVAAQADADGSLAEQSTAHPQVAEMVAPWEARWGPVACPLLWSHAMYLLMEAAAGGWS